MTITKPLMKACMAATLIACCGCVREHVEEPPDPGKEVQTPPPTGLEVNPARPQTENPEAR